jgi:hypothetical protein
MTSLFRSVVLSAVAATAAFFVTQPAVAQNDGRAVAQCRAEMLRQFPAGAVQSDRVASINGNSRRIRVQLIVNADRRYTFDCATDGEGAIQTAALNPPSTTRLAGQPPAQGQ